MDKEALNILIIFPESNNMPGDKQNLPRPSFLPASVSYLAGNIPAKHKITLIDERVDPVPFDNRYDLIAISAMTANVLRAYEIAGIYMRMNKPVIIGGAHASLNSEEALQHCNSVCIGEAENLVGEIILDVQNHSLKKIYKSDYPSLDHIPFARHDLLSLNKYGKTSPFFKKPMIPIFFSRGCPHNCTYCVSPTVYGRRMRYRPVEEFVEEVKYHDAEIYWVTDDNLLANPQKAAEVFEALIPLKRKFTGQFDAKSYQYPDILKLAGKAGFILAQVGIESFDENTLQSVNKTQNRIANYDSLVRVFQDAGISLQAAVMVGFENDTAEIISNIPKNLIKYRFKDAGISMITPYPGTQFFSEMDKKGLIRTKDWTKYRRDYPIILPGNLSVDQFINLYWNVWKEFFSLKNIIKRVMFKPSKYWLLFFFWCLGIKRKIAQRKNPMTD